MITICAGGRSRCESSESSSSACSNSLRRAITVRFTDVIEPPRAGPPASPAIEAWICGPDRPGQLEEARPERGALVGARAPARPLDDGDDRDRRQEECQQEAHGQRRDGGVRHFLERELLPVRSPRWQWLVGCRHQNMK